MSKFLSSISIFCILLFGFTPQITFALSESQQVNSMLQAKITTSNQLDQLWMGYFASKDVRFVEKIISVYEDAVSDPRIDDKDIVLLVKGIVSPEFRQRHDAELKALPKKYQDGDSMQKLLLASAALWSLSSNAAQCPLVNKTIEKHNALSLKNKESRALKHV